MNMVVRETPVEKPASRRARVGLSSEAASVSKPAAKTPTETPKPAPQPAKAPSPEPYRHGRLTRMWQWYMRRNKFNKAVIGWLAVSNVTSAMEAGRATFVNMPPQMAISQDFAYPHSVRNVFNTLIMLQTNTGLTISAATDNNNRLAVPEFLLRNGEMAVCTDLAPARATAHFIERIAGNMFGKTFGQDAAQVMMAYRIGFTWPGAIAGGIITSVGVGLVEAGSGGRLEHTHPCIGIPKP